jgi:hypothetical protein
MCPDIIQREFAIHIVEVSKVRRNPERLQMKFVLKIDSPPRKLGSLTAADAGGISLRVSQNNYNISDCLRVLTVYSELRG